ncbi:gliding motility-associated C-terminal domain-containing protein [Pontibacter populi]|uniref:Gliding motility-associated C-terminal domain-containing protein n=1 Tax=Pontibacter populi TaxID=890055 RepID=A0ABV1RSB3_9BACT
MAREVWLTLFSRAAAFIVCFFIVGAFSQVFAQKESNIWYFGNGAGLDFNSGAPTVLTDGGFDASEGTASVADASGKLLFYSDGTAVWNKEHQIMSNGANLAGNANSAQSCIIVKNPGKQHIYYLFTTGANGSGGLAYSTIDMSRNNGLGEVIEKNTYLHTPVAEKLTAVQHRNKRDTWVVVEEHGSSTFLSFLVDEAGVDVTVKAVSSSFSSDIYPPANVPVNAIGCMKISPDGYMLAVANRRTNTTRLFKFDNATGTLGLFSTPTFSGAVTLSLGSGPYGVEFSPDNSKLYVSTDQGTRIYQYDLNLNNPASIDATGVLIGEANLDRTIRYIGGSLQLAPDGKIYLAKPYSAHMGVIKDPNNAGIACNYDDKGLYLSGRRNGMGLPAFVQSNFAYPSDVKFTIRCFGEASTFTFDAAPWDKPTFMQWNFGDPASGNNNTAGSLSANHNFSAPGEYTVTFTRHIANREETYTITIVIQAPAVVNLGPDRNVCPGTEVTLDATTTGATYKWSNGSTSPTITTTTPGNYWVDVTVGPCTTRDEVKISNYSLPTVNLGADRELCEGQTIELNAFNQGATYLWQDGSTNPTFTVTKAGKYTVEVTSAEGCKTTDEITIVYNALPVINLGPDRDICANTTITLDATQPGMTYEWSTGATTPTITIADAGEYWVTLTNSKGCSAADAIRIKHLPIPIVNLGPNETLCTGDTKLLDATYPNSTYLWQDGSTNPTFLVSEPGKYWVDVTNELGCVVRDEIWLPYLTRPAINLGNDTTLCYGDTLIVGRELPGGIRYEWQDGSTEATFAITKPGTYKLKAYNQHCEATDEITVKFKDCIGGLFIPNIITPNGDSKNDVFYIHGLTEDDWELVMFNRWGKEIYRTRNYKNDWAPQAANTGMFYYLLQHPVTGRTYKGWLEVMQ